MDGLTTFLFVLLLLTIVLSPLIIFITAITFLIANVIKIVIHKKKPQHKPAIYVIILALAIIAPLIYYVPYYLFTNGLCCSQNFPKTASFDEKYTAQVREANMGAMDSFHTWVELKDDKGTKETVFRYEGAPNDVELLWFDGYHLQIAYTDTNCELLYHSAERPQIKPHEQKWKNVTIIFKDKCPKE